MAAIRAFATKPDSPDTTPLLPLIASRSWLRADIACGRQIGNPYAMKVMALTVAGCIFWLVPLVAAIRLFWQLGFYEDGFGFNYESLPLLGIPIFMIATTLVLARLASRRPLPGIATVVSSSIAVVAAFFWLGVWGQGV